MWATSTCKLGWEVMGIFPPGADGSDINCVDASSDRRYAVAGDDFSTICVYNFPVLKNSQACRRLTGHSEHVPKTRFYDDNGDNMIISIGGNDRTIIQWKEIPQTEEEKQ